MAVISNIWYNDSALVIEGAFGPRAAVGEEWVCPTVKSLDFHGEIVLDSSGQPVTVPMVALNQSYLDSLYIGSAASDDDLTGTAHLAGEAEASRLVERAVGPKTIGRAPFH
jgi:hypothetical protein